MTILKNRFCFALAALVLASLQSLSANTTDLSEQDANAPFGWVVCAAKSGGDYTLTGGGNSDKVITLQSEGTADMKTTIYNAIKNNDIVIFDGSGENGTDFIVSSYMTLSSLSNKTIVGINGARLCTQWVLTDEDRAKLDSANVKNASTSSGTGGTLSNGQNVSEKAEYLTRSILLEKYGNENYRNAGIFYMKGCSNIIMRNLILVGPGSCDVSGYDLLCCTSSTKHVWVDHCDFVDGIDGNFDITQKADLITVSWCKFHYTNRSYMHQNTNLVGSSDSETTGYLNVTFANNLWGEGCRARMPMARVGFIHMLNNYFNCAGNATACINPRKNSTFVIEGNYFENGVQKVFEQKDCLGYRWADTNYIGQFGVSKPSSTNASLAMPYTYNIYNVQDVPATLTAANGAGATLADPLTIGRNSDGLDQITADDNDEYYDILGRRVKDLQKGMIYIKNGIKIVIK